MQRTVLAAAAGAVVLSLTLIAHQAHSAPRVRANDAFRRLVARLPRLGASGMAAPGAPAARNHSTAFVLETLDTVFLDRDEDGNLTFGDELVVRGPLVSYTSGADVGTWEGTLTVTNDVTFMTHLTLLFAGSGTLTISGAPYMDGTRDGEVFIAPIVGTTGRVKARYGAGFFNDSAGNLVVALGAR